LITISGVNVARDLGHAKIYFTVLEADSNLVATILNKASSYLRTALARSSKQRTVPQLHFVYDASVDYGRRLSRLIDAVNPPSESDASE